MTERLIFNRHHGDAPPNAVYIGRGSDWGNPYVIGPDGTREDVIRKYEVIVKGAYGLMTTSNKERLSSLHGKPLECFCYPRPCHGEVLHKYAAMAKAELVSDPMVDF